MTYCTMTDFSDIYAFEAAPGCFRVMVAHGRLPYLPEHQADQMCVEEYREWARAQMKPIGGRCDGMSFREGSAHALFCRLRDLLALGYRVDPKVWEELQRCHPELGLEGKWAGPVPPAGRQRFTSISESSEDSGIRVRPEPALLQ